MPTSQHDAVSPTATPTWEELKDTYEASVRRMHERARALYGEMVSHVVSEIERTGADILLEEPGSVLPKQASDGPIAMRMDVTPGTILYSRQSHAAEPPGEKHRSWRVDLESASALPLNVRDGLSHVVEAVAALQGRPSPLGLETGLETRDPRGQLDP